MLHLNEEALVHPGLFSELTGRQVKAWGSAPYIKQALKKRASVSISCTDKDGNDRTLLHHAGLRPIARLLWPLSLLEARDVSFYVSEGTSTDASTIRSALFSRWQTNRAIATFLDGVNPDAIVTIRIYDLEPPVAPLFGALLSLIFSLVALVATNLTPFIALGWFAITGNWQAAGVICTAAGLIMALTCVAWLPFSAYIHRTAPNRATWLLSALAYCAPLILTTVTQPIFIEKFTEATVGTAQAWTLVLAGMLGVFPWVYAVKFHSNQVIFIYRGGLFAGMFASAYLISKGLVATGVETFLLQAMVVCLAKGLAETIPDPEDPKL